MTYVKTFKIQPARLYLTMCTIRINTVVPSCLDQCAANKRGTGVSANKHARLLSELSDHASLDNFGESCPYDASIARCRLVSTLKLLTPEKVSTVDTGYTRVGSALAPVLD